MLAQGSLVVELRSVNNRFLDLQFRVIEELRSLEPGLRELIAAKKENEKAIAEFIGLDSLHYLTVEGMIKATGLRKDCFCLACFNGKYPIAPPEKIDKFCMELK